MTEPRDMTNEGGCPGIGDVAVEELVRIAKEGAGRGSQRSAAVDELARRLREAGADAARFRFWFSPTAKHVDINRYLQGVREGWDLDQWRVYCDDAARNAKEDPDAG